MKTTVKNKDFLASPVVNNRPRSLIYFLAISLTLLTVFLRISLGSAFGEYPTLIIFTIPIILCAYWGGLWPGLLAVLVSYLGASYFLLPPIYSFAIADPMARWQQTTLILAGTFISILCELLHRSQRRANSMIVELQSKERELSAGLSELKQAEIVSSRLAVIVESSDDAIIGKDLNSIVTSWNKGAEKIFGYTTQEMVGESIMRLIPSDRQNEEHHILEKIKRGEPIKHFETLRQTRDGRLIDISVTISPIKDSAGNIIGVSKMARDITERKRVETALKEREEQLRLYVEHSPVAIAMFDRNMKYLVVSRHWLESFRLNGQSLIGRSHYEVFPEVSEHWKGIHRRCLAGAVEKSEEDPFLRLDGSTDWLRWEVRPWHKTDKSIGGIIIFSEDITERKLAEESSRLLRSAVEQSKESIIITDAQLDLPGPKIIFVNPAFTQMTGYTAEEAIGKTPRILQGPRTNKGVLARLRKNLEEGTVFEGEAINYRKDGKEFDLEWQVTPLRNGDGKITHFVATQHDITARKKLETQYLQSQKMEGIGQLAGGVAHDFNNILAVIQMQSELMKMSGDLSMEQTESADEITHTVKRAAALTRQLLLFSRREVFQPRDFDLSETIANMTKMLMRTLGENVRIELKLASQPMFIHADAGMMDQVLLNLVVNARDAMPNGGQLIIETSGVEFDEFAASQSPQARSGSFVCLNVSDSGCGIAPENFTKIFEPFFTTKDVGKGTGLGLATVFGIVQQHQGWINVYSEVNHGTTFRIYLPRLAKNGTSKASPSELIAMRGGNETILLVEDDPSLRVSVRKALSQLGYRILEAPTGVKALDVWKENRQEIRLLLTDLVMPDGMTGRDLAQRLLRENPQLKVIYMSGYSAEVVGKNFPLKEGVNFLTKPFPALKLAQTIRDCLDLKG